MKEVEYAKLSEQYANFLVAVGGVSITVLTLVLSIGPSTNLSQGDLGSFLVTGLVVATVCCFTGAHMMAETAAYITRVKEKLQRGSQQPEIPPAGTQLGNRLFLLASTNIFIAIVLVLFALMLLPSTSNFTNASSMKGISFVIFILVVAGALWWMILAAKHRMRVNGFKITLRKPLIIGSGWLCLLFGFLVVAFLFGFFEVAKMLLLWFTFIPITLITVATLVYFASSLKDSEEAISRDVNITDIHLFGTSITISYASIIVAGIRTMFF